MEVKPSALPNVSAPSPPLFLHFNKEASEDIKYFSLISTTVTTLLSSFSSVQEVFETHDEEPVNTLIPLSLQLFAQFDGLLFFFKDEEAFGSRHDWTDP